MLRPQAKWLEIKEVGRKKKRKMNMTRKKKKEKRKKRKKSKQFCETKVAPKQVLCPDNKNSRLLHSFTVHSLYTFTALFAPHLKMTKY